MSFELMGGDEDDRYDLYVYHAHTSCHELAAAQLPVCILKFELPRPCLLEEKIGRAHV